MAPRDYYERISVWEQSDNGMNSAWSLREISQEYVGTRDELKYFRVIDTNGKHFFQTPYEYIEFTGADINDPENDFKGIIELWQAKQQALREEAVAARA